MLARAEADLRAARVAATTTAAQRAAKEASAAQQGQHLRGRRPKVADHQVEQAADGWVQGYNAQAAVCANTQVVLACLVSQNANDVELYQPMVAASATGLLQAGIDGSVALFLADAGYWSEANATAEGPHRLIATLKD